MKIKFLLFLLTLFLFQACSWVVPFYIVNTTDKPFEIEIKLMRSVNSFPIFNSREFYLYEGSDKKIDWEKQKEVVPDTLEDLSHLKFTLPAHSSVEIGRLNNDKYEKYDQYFINGRVFNLEGLLIKQGGKETRIVPATFDTYFKKENQGVTFRVK